MRLLLFTYFVLLSCFAANGQMVWGVVIDRETAKPLYPVAILNLATRETTNTDEQGKYSIHARSGDTLAFSLAGYRTGTFYAVPGIPLEVHLVPFNVKLPAYVLHDMTNFQRDSVAKTQLYSKELNQRPVKVGWSSANGGGFSGLIGGPIQKISRSYKQNKRFKKNFNDDLQQQFIDTRYTPALVNSLTRLTGDTLLFFMNHYPMEYDFARRGSDLEIKIWVRENFKNFSDNPELLKQIIPVDEGKGK
jgi:CarboxypepD_reg-like domain